jgi:hypothetical protein
MVRVGRLRGKRYYRGAERKRIKKRGEEGPGLLDIEKKMGR